MKFAVLASSSAGNCTYVEGGGARILVDAGTNRKAIAAALEPLGVALADVDAILLTHEHDDHVSALAVVERRLGTPVYATFGTFDGYEQDHGGPDACDGWERTCFEPGEPFAIGGLSVEPFSTPHDAADPVGFVLSDGASRLGFATDLGFATELVAQRLRGCSALALEFNHDVRMLELSGRHPNLIQRIRGRSGHLSNDQAAELLASVAGPGLRHVVPMHLSGECNDPALAVAAARDALRAAGLDPGLVRPPACPTPLYEI
jgi:phosphoribosyl 1,2-cyclic phosphodiesterase